MILVLRKYGDTQNGTSSARRSVSEARVETIDGDVRLMSWDARTVERRFSCSVVPAREVEEDGIAKYRIYSLRIKRSRPITGIASNCDDDGLSGCQINTGKNEQDRRMHRWRTVTARREKLG